MHCITLELCSIFCSYRKFHKSLVAVALITETDVIVSDKKAVYTPVSLLCEKSSVDPFIAFVCESQDREREMNYQLDNTFNWDPFIHI